MKYTKKYFLFLIGILFFNLISCEKANEQDFIIQELATDGIKTSIETTSDGIEYKFCLLNEAGQPAITFNKDENFSFYFSATNRRNEKLFFDPDYIYSNENEFCRVFNSANQDLGKPFIFKSANLIGIAAYDFASNKTYLFEQPWIDKRETTWNWKYGFFESSNKELLPTGNYYTTFKYRFKYRNSENKQLYTDSLILKINFKIQ